MPVGDRVQRVGRRAAPRRVRPGPRNVRATSADQVVGAGPDDDLLRLDARIRCGGLAQLAIRALRILVQRREALAERDRRHARERRHVRVEAQHLAPARPCAAATSVAVGAPRRTARSRPRAGGRASPRSPARTVPRPPPRGAAGPRLRRARATVSRIASSPSRRRRHDLDRLQERLEAEPAGGARETARRQHVVGARRVVADDRGGRRAEEDRARVPHPRGEQRRDRRRAARGARARTRRTRASASSSEPTTSIRTCSQPPTSRSTSAASAALVVTSMHSESGPCSAWASRSAAQSSASAVSSATTSTSLGPAGRSMPTRPETRSFAAVTQRLPGPTILSTAGIVSVP